MNGTSIAGAYFEKWGLVLLTSPFGLNKIVSLPDVFRSNYPIVCHTNLIKEQIFAGSAPLNELNTAPESKTIVLVSQPGIAHNVLLNLLRTLPQTSVHETYGALSAFEFIESNHVDAIIVNANLFLTERLALVRRIKSCFPFIQCIVLTMTTRNHESIRTSGADQILMQDTSLAEMERTILAW